MKEEQDDEGDDIMIMTELNAEWGEGEKNEDTDKVDPSRDATKRTNECLFLLAPGAVKLVLVFISGVANRCEGGATGPSDKAPDAAVDKLLELKKFFMEGLAGVLEKVVNSFQRKRPHEETETNADEAESDLDCRDLGYFIPCRLDAPESGEKDDEDDGMDGFADFHMEIPPKL